MIGNVIFDLDGTLTDPIEGVARSIRYALENMGYPSEHADLRWCIGPPITKIFSTLLNSTEDHLIKEAISLYRKRYVAIGKYENRLYPDIEAALEQLKGGGIRLFVATFKPTQVASDILNHFKLAHYFDSVSGSGRDEETHDKNDIVSSILRAAHLQPMSTVMVGDRKHDIIAAKQNQIVAAGVSYGYGSEEELRSAGADYILHAIKDIMSLGQIRQRQQGLPAI